MVGQVGLNGLKKLSTQTQPNLTRLKIKFQSNPTPPRCRVELSQFHWVGKLDAHP